MIDILNWFRSIMNSGSVLGYFFQAVPITCIVGIIYVIIRVVIVKRNRLKVEWLQEMMKLLFTCYLTGLISLVVLPANFWLYFFDGVFLGWWEEMFPIFSFGGFNLVPSLIKALSGEFTIGSWVREHSDVFTVGPVSSLCYRKSQQKKYLRGIHCHSACCRTAADGIWQEF